MKELQPLGFDNAPEESRDVLESVSDDAGEVSNLLRVLAHSPSALRAYVALDKLASDCDLSPAERRIVMLTASFENRCEYCMAAHSTGADTAGLDEETLQALREGQQIRSNDRFEAIRAFTCKVVRQRGHISETDAREFLDADFEESNILDVILIVAMKVLSNYTNHIAGTPLDERFEKMYWEPVDTRAAGRRTDDRQQGESATRH